jgi:hypothetical protein
MKDFKSDMSVLILVKPANSKANPKPKGAFTGTVRSDHAEGS